MTAKPLDPIARVLIIAALQDYAQHLPDCADPLVRKAHEIANEVQAGKIGRFVEK